jgi:uncharacterized protein YpiB (UPF0302 family)
VHALLAIRSSRQAAIKKEMAEVTADKTVPEKDKKDLLKELEEALQTAQSVQYPSNIELVRKYYDKIDPAYSCLSSITSSAGR